VSPSINAAILNCIIVENYSPNKNTGFLENATDNPKWLTDRGEFLVDTRTGTITPKKGASLGVNIGAARDPHSSVSVINDEGFNGSFFNAIYITLYNREREQFTNSQIKRQPIEEMIQKAYALDHLVIQNGSSKASPFSYHNSFGDLTTGICTPL